MFIMGRCVWKKYPPPIKAKPPNIILLHEDIKHCYYWEEKNIDFLL